MTPYESPNRKERLEADSSCARPGAGQVSLQKATSLAQMPSPNPEAEQGTRQAQRQLHLFLSPRRSRLEDSSQVVQIAFQTIEPQRLLGTPDERLSLLRKRHVVARVRPAGGVELSLLLQAFQPALTNGFQHDESKCFPFPPSLPNQPLSAQGPRAVNTHA